MKNISFDNPYLLLIFIPLLLVVLIPYLIAIRKENKSKSTVTSLVLHILIATCFTLAISGFMYTTVMTETQVFVVADVSHSTNRNLEQVDNYISEIQKKLPNNSKMGVVCFGKDQKLLTGLGGEFTTVKNAGIDDSATDISGALEYAGGLFSSNVIKRIILITDGNETSSNATGELVSAVEALYAKDIQIDAIYLDDNLPEGAKEVQISDVDFTASTYKDHITTADALIQTSFDTPAIAVLYQDGVRVDNQAVTLTKGYNIVNFDLSTDTVGTFDYRIAITADGDTFTSNNTYDFTQSVAGNLNVLLISDETADLPRVQELYGDTAEIDAYIQDPNVPCSVEALCKYDEIILSNVDVRELNNYTAFIDAVDKAVSVFGKSLVTLGDLRIQNKTDDVLKQLEDMLPVKFGNSDQDPKLYAIVIDTSRSMQNFSRLLIAKQAAIQLLNLLSDEDYVMIVNFWGEINVLQSPTRAANRTEIIKKINAIEPYQGTVIGTALNKAGELMIDLAYDQKQIMLISDGMSYTLESDTPTDVVEKLKDNGITTSVIHPTPREEGEATLRGIAAAGGGSYYEIKDEASLQEVMFSQVADDLTESVIQKRTSVNINLENDDVLNGIRSLPDVQGYVYAKAKASATTVLTVDYVKSSGTVIEAPLYTYWGYGNGKVTTFTSKLSGGWTDEWQGDRGTLFFENVLTVNTPTEKIDYPYTLNIAYDGIHSEVEVIPVTLDPYATAEATIIMPNGTQVTETLTFDSSRYFYEFDTPEKGKYEIAISYTYGGVEYTSNSAFNISYSPEYDSFAVFDPSNLHAAIRNRGTVTEGEIPSLKNDEKNVATYTIHFLIPLMIAAVVLFVVDIIIRKLKMADIKSFFKRKAKKKGGVG